MEKSFAGRVSLMTGSVLREIVKVTEQPGMISFAGVPPDKLFDGVRAN